MKTSLRVFLLVFIIGQALIAGQKPAVEKVKFIRYGCSEYAERLRPLTVNFSTLIPWGRIFGKGCRFYDGVFLADDDSRIMVVVLKNDYRKRRFDHEAQFFIYDTARGLWDRVGAEFLHQDYSLIPLRADSGKFVFAKQAGEKARTGEIVTYDVKSGVRTAAIFTKPEEYNKAINAGRYETSGLSRELKPGEPGRYISASRINAPGRYYEGIVAVYGAKLEQTEVLRFGSDPRYLRHTPVIEFRYRNGLNSFFGFYDTSEAGPVYTLNGDNRVYRHYESGVLVKQYINLTRLRAVSPSLEKFLFMAEDEAGPRLLVVSLPVGLFRVH
jgi:hypothetical protein